MTNPNQEGRGAEPEPKDWEEAMTKGEANSGLSYSSAYPCPPNLVDFLHLWSPVVLIHHFMS